MSQLGNLSGNVSYGGSSYGSTINQTQTPLTYGANYQLNLQRYNAALAGYQSAMNQQLAAGKNIVGQYASGGAAQQNQLQAQWQSVVPNLQQQMISKGLGGSTVLSGMTNQANQQYSMAQNALAGQIAQGLAGVEAGQQAAYQQAAQAQNNFIASQTAPVGQAEQFSGYTAGGQGSTQGNSAYNYPTGGGGVGAPIGAAGSLGYNPSVAQMQSTLGAGATGGGASYGNGGGGGGSYYTNNTPNNETYTDNSGSDDPSYTSYVSDDSGDYSGS